MNGGSRSTHVSDEKIDFLYYQEKEAFPVCSYTCDPIDRDFVHTWYNANPNPRLRYIARSPEAVDARTTKVMGTSPKSKDGSGYAAGNIAANGPESASV